MLRTRSIVSALALLLSVAAFNGCSPDNSVSDIKQSAQATNADEAGRKATLEAMKNKGVTPGGKPAPGASSKPASPSPSK